MTKGWKQPKQGKKRKAELLSAHNVVQKFLKQSGDAGSDNEDPRFQNTSSRPLSRKARRKQERKAKKARKNVYFSHKNGAPVMVCCQLSFINNTFYWFRSQNELEKDPAKMSNLGYTVDLIFHRTFMGRHHLH